MEPDGENELLIAYPVEASIASSRHRSFPCGDFWLNVAWLSNILESAFP